MTKPVYVSKFALSIEDLLGPLPRQTEGFWECSQKFDDLGNVIIILAILGAGLRVKQIVTGDQFKNLPRSSECGET